MSISSQGRKNMKKSVLLKRFIGVLLLTTGICLDIASAQAQDVGIVAGYRSDYADGDANVTVSSKGNFQGGVVVKFGLSSSLLLRSGLMYTQRAYGFQVPALSLNGTIQGSFFEIPVGLLYKFSDYGGVFGGVAPSFGLAKTCSIDGSSQACTIGGQSTSPMTIQFGASFKVAPQFGFELYYEQMLAAYADSVKSPRALVLQAMVTFD
ncbi:MAG: hypothetical protein C5B49_12555 [Bdellovibrio sp.]|nr:MAG: hypothetical protein C5B49_12555 [Bdellovibrio sp.]